MTKELFQKIIREISNRDTSSNPKDWSKNNPLFGHCAVVSLIAQEYFGGCLLRQSLKTISEFAKMKSHYLNQLEDGTIIDFTVEQFEGKLSIDIPKETRSREQVLLYPDTQKRYDLLKYRFKQYEKSHRQQQHAKGI